MAGLRIAPRPFCAFLLAALQPWNVALWWQLTRLKKAIELDCDQRIVNAGVDIWSYGNLLLRIASRRGAMPLTALTVSNGRTFVERRITAMADHKVGGKHLRAVLAAFCGVVLFGLGCETPSPMGVEKPDADVQQQEIIRGRFVYVLTLNLQGVAVDIEEAQPARMIMSPMKLSLGIPIPDPGEDFLCQIVYSAEISVLLSNQCPNAQDIELLEPFKGQLIA